MDARGLPEPALTIAEKLGVDGYIGKAPRGGVLLKLTENAREVGDDVLVVVRIDSGEDQGKVIEVAEGGAKRILVETADWKVIPLENVIAATQDMGVELYARAEGPEEATMLSGILEKGVSGVVVSTSSPDRLVEMIEALIPTSRIELRPADVKAVELVGMGDRVCVDTSNLLRVGEGALVGNSSNFLFLVHGETIETEYVAARPFRVNAGGIHSYILLPDGKTKYLSEMGAGDHVLISDWEGRTRRAIVGRAKIERRPMVLVEAEAEGRSGTILLQYAETIRLVRPDGTPISCTEISKGEEVLVHMPEAGARHFGMAVDEFIIEK